MSQEQIDLKYTEDALGLYFVKSLISASCFTHQEIYIVWEWMGIACVEHLLKLVRS